MRTPSLILTCLATALVSIATAQAEPVGTPYYNPANEASETGNTSGSNLYKTIGCPGRGLLDPACQEEAAALPQAATPAPVAAATPAVTTEVQPGAAPAERPAMVVSEEKAAPAVSAAVTSNVPASQPGGIKFEECYSDFVKVAADSFRNSAAAFFKLKDAGQ